MRLADYFASQRGGTASVTKTFVTLAHLALFATVVGITIKTGVFDLQMWSLYLGATIFHATYDKTLATVTAYKTDKNDKAIVFGKDPDSGAPLEP